MVFALVEEGLSKYPNQARLNSIAGYGYFLRFGQEGDEADFKKALEYKEKNFWLNPYDFSNIVYVELLMLNKEFNKAIEVCNIIKKQDESLLSEYRLGEIYYYMGDLEQSQAIFQQFDSPLEFKIGALLHLGMIAVQRGEREKAKKILQEIHILIPSDFMFSYNQLKLSSIYLRLGTDEKGYEFLRSFFNLEINKKIKYISKKYIDIDENFERFKEEDEFLKIMKGEH